MATIEHDYSPGDTVFIVANNTVYSGVCQQVEIDLYLTETETETRIHYIVLVDDVNIGTIIILPEYIFANMNDALTQLSNIS